MTDSSAQPSDRLELSALTPRTLPAAATRRPGSRFLAALRQDWSIWLVAGVTLANGLLSIASVLAVRVAETPRL